MSDAIDCQLRLADGRLLGYAEYGDPVGTPIFYCHGFPASRLEGSLLDTTAKRLGARIVAADRPGHGLSDFQPGRRLIDWSDDVIGLADKLGIDRFAVLGISGGGPYTLACAGKAPQRVAAAAIVCGLGPVYLDWAIRDMRWPVGLAFQLAQKRRCLLKWIVGGVVVPILKARPQLIRAILLAKGSSADRAVLQRPDIGNPLLVATREALRQGATGIVHDLILYAHFWSLSFPTITTPIALWHGQADATVPVSHTRYLAEVLPNARAHVLAGEGHFSLPVNHMAEVLAFLLAA
ncbi:MAG: alpha/beta hydrolase [Gammaproteobacteria bacterium]